MKPCTKCAKVLPATTEYFTRDRKSSTGLNSWCKKCRTTDTRRWARANPEQAAEADWWKKLRNKGITPSIYAGMLSKQDGKCAICANSPEPRKYFDVDHCHATGKIRGLLCRECNHALGFFKDKPGSLSRAVLYLAGELRQSIFADSVPLPRLHKLHKYLIKKYGITPEDYVVLWSSQYGRCKICESSFYVGKRLSACIDHSHTKNVVRGLLCNGCNVGIGKFKENPLLITTAIQYLDLL